MDTLTEEFSNMRKRHQKAVNSANNSVERMSEILADLSRRIAHRDQQSATADDPPPSQPPPTGTPDNTPNDKDNNAGNAAHPDPEADGDEPMSESQLDDTDVSDKALLSLLKTLHSTSKTLQSSLVSDHKSVGAAMNKYGKAIDNTTATNLGDLCAPVVRLPTTKINDAIASHLFREGMFDVGRSFLLEAAVHLHDDHIRPFERLYRILTAFRRDDLDPAIAWTQEKRPFLHVAASHLEFRLHCLAYLQILQRGHRDAALSYARTHLSTFPQHISTVQKLMTCLLYASSTSSLSSSPYKDLVHPSRRDDIERCLSREYCRAQGLAKDSLLLTVVRCGTKAIPTLLKASRVFSNLQELGIDDALPVEVDVGRDCCFHSIFTCPVSKEEASDASNMPKILPCGHVLSKQSINRLPRGNTRFKCPYCPMEQNVDECRELRF